MYKAYVCQTHSSVVSDIKSGLDGPLLSPNNALLRFLLFNCPKWYQIQFHIFIYSSNFPCERLFLFDRTNLRQSYSVRAVVALLCLRSCATRKTANGPCSSYSAEETLFCSISTLFLDLGTAQSCPATHTSFASLPASR